MTLAILDGESLARHGCLDGYAAERAARSWASERLGAALQRTLTGQDPATLLLPQVAFDLWRRDPVQRDRVLGLLGMRDDRRSAFGGVVVWLVRDALAQLASGVRGVSPAEPGRLRMLTDLAEWLMWLIGPKVGTPWRGSGKQDELAVVAAGLQICVGPGGLRERVGTPGQHDEPAVGNLGGQPR